MFSTANINSASFNTILSHAIQHSAYSLFRKVRPDISHLIRCFTTDRHASTLNFLRECLVFPFHLYFELSVTSCISLPIKILRVYGLYRLRHSSLVYLRRLHFIALDCKYFRAKRVVEVAYVEASVRCWLQPASANKAQANIFFCGGGIYAGGNVEFMGWNLFCCWLMILLNDTVP